MPFDGIVTRAVTEELKEAIIPGRINKIYQPTTTDLLLTIRSKGKNHSLLISIHPTYARFHLTNDAYKNPEVAPNFCMVLRKHLSGAIIQEITQFQMERIITLSVRTRNEIGDESEKIVVIELMGKHSNVMLVDKEKGHIIDSMKHITFAQNRHRTILPGQEYILPPTQNKLNPLDIQGKDLIKKLDFNSGKIDKQMVALLMGFSPFVAREIIKRVPIGSSIHDYGERFNEVKEQLLINDYQPTIYRHEKEDFHVIPIHSINGEKEVFQNVSSMLDTFYSGKAERDRVKQQAKDLYRFIKNEQNKNKRKLKKHNQTLKKAENAEEYRRLGELLTANLHLVKKGDKKVNVMDYYDPEQQEVTIDLNPNKTPSENAQSFFKTYQKLKNSKQAVQQEITKTKLEIEYLEQLLQQIDVAAVNDIEEIREELREEGYLKKQRTQKRKNKEKKPQPEKYIATDGTEILVGKNNKQNEYLTMKLARKDEFWLHTKDIPGSHVIIRSMSPSEETLIEAACLAAYFSKSQNSSSVPVDYTKVRHVKKPNGAKPGFVIYDNQQTLFVTPSKDIVEQLKN